MYTFADQLAAHARTLTVGVGATASAPYRHIGNLCVAECERRLAALAPKLHSATSPTERARRALNAGVAADGMEGALANFHFYERELFDPPVLGPESGTKWTGAAAADEDATERVARFAEIASEAQLARLLAPRSVMEERLAALEAQFAELIVARMLASGAAARFLHRLDRALHMEERAAALEAEAERMRSSARDERSGLPLV